MADFKITELSDDIDFGALPYWDVVIIGAGPAGLAAGLTTAHRGLTTLIVEAKDKPGGQPQFLYADKRIVDVPGFPDGITGEELSARTYRQAVDALVQFRFNEELVAIDETDQQEKDDLLKRVVTNQGAYLCRKVIIACGLLHYPRKLAVLDRLGSRNVYYKVPKIGDYEGRRVAVVGGGDSALDAALMVLGRHGQVDLLVREATPVGKADSLARVREAGGTVHLSTEISAAEIAGEQMRLMLTTSRTDCQSVLLDCDLAIVQIGFLSARDTFERLGVRLNEDGSIAIDPYYESSRRGIFAAGDVHGDIKLITVAWAEGIQAAIYAFKEITSPYWLNEKRLRDHKITMIGEKITQAARTRR
jgi:thioredoxin reductase (NADPH)